MIKNLNNDLFKEINSIFREKSLPKDINNINNRLRKYAKKIHVLSLMPKIGHLAMCTEEFMRNYFLNRDEYIRNNEYFMFSINFNVYPKFPQIANEQLLSMLDRNFLIIDNEALKLIKLLSEDDNELWDLDDKKLYTNNILDFNRFNNAKPQLAFTIEEEKKGLELLKSMGISKNDKFICFTSRDNEYAESIGWTNSDYANDFRNCDIESYNLALEYLTDMGFYCIRIGQIVNKPLKNKNSRIIDYSLNYRSAFGDMYLPSKNKFFLGCASGMTNIASIFNVPVVMTNICPFGWAPYLKKDLYIYKKYFYKEENRYLTFKELHNAISEKWGCMGIQNYKKLGVEIIDNTPKEILDVTKEMVQRIENKWVLSIEDEELQNRFKDIFEDGVESGNGSPARIGTAFLKNNIELFL